MVMFLQMNTFFVVFLSTASIPVEPPYFFETKPRLVKEKSTLMNTDMLVDVLFLRSLDVCEKLTKQLFIHAFSPLYIVRNVCVCLDMHRIIMIVTIYSFVFFNHETST